MSVMNVATYGYQMVAARALGPQEYGAFAALMNLLLVVSVMSLGAQATAARRIAAEPRARRRDRAVRAAGQLPVRCVLGLVLLALTPLINLVLRLESLASAAVDRR